MIFPKIEVSWQLIFNNTGLDWTKLQPYIINGIENYGVLHCITDKWYEDQSDHYFEVDGIPFLIYVRVNTKELCIDCVAVKTVKRELQEVNNEAD